MGYLVKLGLSCLISIAGTGFASATTYRYDVVSNMQSTPYNSWEEPGEFQIFNRFELDVTRLEQEMPPEWSKLSVTLYYFAYGWKYSFYSGSGALLPEFSKEYETQDDHERWLTYSGEADPDYFGSPEYVYQRVSFDRSFNITGLEININADDTLHLWESGGGYYADFWYKEYGPSFGLTGYEVSRTITRTTISTDVPTEPVEVAPVPLPGSLALLLMGMLGLVAARSSRISHFC